MSGSPVAAKNDLAVHIQQRRRRHRPDPDIAVRLKCHPRRLNAPGRRIVAAAKRQVKHALCELAVGHPDEAGVLDAEPGKRQLR